MDYKLEGCRSYSAKFVNEGETDAVHISSCVNNQLSSLCEDCGIYSILITSVYIVGGCGNIVGVGRLVVFVAR